MESFTRKTTKKELPDAIAREYIRQAANRTLFNIPDGLSDPYDAVGNDEPDLRNEDIAQTMLEDITDAQVKEGV
jgi:hypothetical protein